VIPPEQSVVQEVDRPPAHRVPERGPIRIRISAFDLSTIVFVGLAALLVRLWAVADKSVWYDEAVSIFLANQPIPNILEAVTNDIHPPLYYLLLHFWLIPQENEAWVRLLSALFSVGAVLMTYELGRVLFDREVGALGALFTALSSMSVATAQEARMYALMGLVSLASIYFLYRALTASRRLFWVGYTLATTLMLYTHYYAVYVIALEVAFGVAYALLKPRARPLLRPLGLSLIVALILFAPWLPALRHQLEAAKGGLWIGPVDRSAMWEAFRQILMYSHPAEPPGTWDHFRLSMGRWLFTAAGAVGLVTLSKRWQVSLLLLFVAVPIVGAYVTSTRLFPIFGIKYLAFVAPAFYLLAARGILVSKASIVRLGVPLFLLYVSVLGLQAWYYDPWYSRPEFGPAAGWLEQNYKGRDLIVHTSFFTHEPMAWYHRRSLNETVLLSPTPDELRRQAQGFERVWLVMGYENRRPELAKSTDGPAQSLGEGLRLVDIRRFSGLNVYLYETPPGVSSSPRPL